MEKTRVLGIAVSNRQNASLKVQSLLTEHGCSIKTRIGMHEVSNSSCSTSGLIILELTGNKESQDKLENNLKAVDGVQVQKMDFDLQ